MDYLAKAARTRPDAPAVIRGDEVVSYRRLDDLADRIGGAVHRAGADLSARVAFWAESTIDAVAALWGIPRSGAWAIPLPPGLPPARAMDLSRLAGARGLWAPPPDGGLESLPGGGALPGSGPPDVRSRYVVFTSGSSGGPKAAVLTGSTIEASASASHRRLGNGPDDPWLCALPLAHVGGLSILWRCAREGAPVVLEARFDAARCGRLLSEGAVAYASLVPTMLQRVLEADPGPYSGVKAVLVGGGPADPSLLSRARAAGLPALATYGMTETSSQIATEALVGDPGPPGSVGRPLCGAEVRVVDPTGREVPCGVTGSIEVRGPMVSPGYVGEEERDPDGWLRTSDLGMLDPEGHLIVVGRADDVILTGGENVHPAPIEAAILAHPAVADVLVYGISDPEWGAAVWADVRLAAGAVWDEAEMSSFLRDRVAAHEVPKHFRIVPEISRTWKR